MNEADRTARSRQHAPNRPHYWFPAKRYGWGWGMPSTWQGWLVIVADLGLMVGAARLCPPEKSVLGFVLAVVVLSAGLVAICWWKGEPVKWRRR